MIPLRTSLLLQLSLGTTRSHKLPLPAPSANRPMSGYFCAGDRGFCHAPAMPCCNASLQCMELEDGRAWCTDHPNATLVNTSHAATAERYSRYHCQEFNFSAPRGTGYIVVASITHRPSLFLLLNSLESIWPVATEPTELRSRFANTALEGGESQPPLVPPARPSTSNATYEQ